MRLIISRDTIEGAGRGRYEAFIETPLGNLSVRDFLKPKVDEYKGRKYGSYTDLLVESGIEHATLYNYMSGKQGFTLAIVSILQTLGYDIQIKKHKD